MSQASELAFFDKVTLLEKEDIYRFCSHEVLDLFEDLMSARYVAHITFEHFPGSGTDLTYLDPLGHDIPGECFDFTTLCKTEVHLLPTVVGEEVLWELTHRPGGHHWWWV
jgi:hypothetical protein